MKLQLPVNTKKLCRLDLFLNSIQQSLIRVPFEHNLTTGEFRTVWRGAQSRVDWQYSMTYCSKIDVYCSCWHHICQGALGCCKSCCNICWHLYAVKLASWQLRNAKNICGNRRFKILRKIFWWTNCGLNSKNPKHFIEILANKYFRHDASLNQWFRSYLFLPAWNEYCALKLNV